MPYFQAQELLENSNCSVDKLIQALEEMAIEYGYIQAMARWGLREDVEIDLVRILMILKALRAKIHENYDNC